MAFTPTQVKTSITAVGSAFGGSQATFAFSLTSPAVANSLLVLFANHNKITGTYPDFGTYLGWRGVDGATHGVDVNNAARWTWMWRIATGGDQNFCATFVTNNDINHIYHILEVPGPNTLASNGTVRSYTSSGHATEASAPFAATEAFFHSWGYRVASFTYYTNPAQWNSLTRADNVPAQSIGVAWYDESGTDGNGTGTTLLATWSKGNSFYFDIGIVAFVQVGGDSIRPRDDGIYSGIYRGVF